MAFLLKELFLLTLVATVLTFPWHPLDDPVGRVQKDFAQPLVDDDITAVDDPPGPDEIYPLTDTKQETSTKRENEPIDTDTPVDKALREVYPVEQDTFPTAVNEPPLDDREEVYPGISTKRAPRIKRGAVTADSGKRWPVTKDGNGENIVNIMYKIQDDLNADAKRWLKTVLYQLDQDTCIHFMDWNGDPSSYYVKFQTGSGGCSSDIGYRKKIQTVDLGAGCQYRKTIAHEIMHLLGFYHEHTRSDRDNYITVYLDNIASGLSGQFAKKNDQDNLGYAYDVHSVMQYGENAFSSNPGDPNLNTMVANNGQKLGQNSHMDAMDVNKINQLYGCNRPTFKDHIIVLNTGSSWWSGAGTDADPFVRLIGSTGTTPFQLVTSGGMLYADENEAGASETHKLPFPDVGTISSVEITLVDKGSTPSKKRKRALKRAQSKWGQEKRWGDGWSLSSVEVDGESFNGADLDVGDTETLSRKK